MSCMCVHTNRVGAGLRYSLVNHDMYTTYLLTELKITNTVLYRTSPAHK